MCRSGCRKVPSAVWRVVFADDAFGEVYGIADGATAAEVHFFLLEFNQLGFCEEPAEDVACTPTRSTEHRRHEPVWIVTWQFREDRTERP